MLTTLINRPSFTFSPKTRELLADLVAYSFLVLFMYTAASKLLTVDKFASTLAKSPLVGSLNAIVAWGVPVVEMMISAVLIIPAFRKQGIYASTGLMIIFTVYLTYMVLSGDKLPCNCGGVIDTMSWQQHIWFNLGFIFIGIFAIALFRKK